jgi:hypothetical protein
MYIVELITKISQNLFQILHLVAVLGRAREIVKYIFSEKGSLLGLIINNHLRFFVHSTRHSVLCMKCFVPLLRAPNLRQK